MNEQNNYPGNSASRGFGGARLIAFLALAAVAVLVGVLVFRVKSGRQNSPAASVASPATSAIASGPGASSKAVGIVEAGPLQQLIRVLNDAAAPLGERKKAAAALAANGSREALQALKDALRTAPPEIRKAIASALGGCSSPDALAMLLNLLKDPDRSVAIAAVQALARQQQPQAATALAQLVTDPGASIALRCEAATALGSIGEAWVLDPLARAAKESNDDDLIAAALDAMGGLDFNVTRNFYSEYLNSPDVSADLRQEAVQSLAYAKGDVSAFLADIVARDADPDVRAEAAWAMGAAETQGTAGAQLLDMLQKETDPDVRLRLYQALSNQQGLDINAAMADVQKESDPTARIAGLDLLAKALRDDPNPQLQGFFDQTAIPELKQAALNAQTNEERQQAIIALSRAHTPEALAALGDLNSQLARIQAAAQGQSSPIPGSQPNSNAGSTRNRGQH